jgi:hypothetical protein
MRMCGGELHVGCYLQVLMIELLRIPLELDLREFILTGKFGFISLGLSKEELENQHFPPEGWQNGQTKETSNIWRYGNFELHFENGNLIRIFNDYLNELDGGQSIKITDYWLLKLKPPTILETMQNLNQLDINFARTSNLLKQVLITTEQGIKLIFEEENGELKLSALSMEGMV